MAAARTGSSSAQLGTGARPLAVAALLHAKEMDARDLHVSRSTLTTTIENRGSQCPAPAQARRELITVNSSCLLAQHARTSASTREAAAIVRCGALPSACTSTSSATSQRRHCLDLSSIWVAHAPRSERRTPRCCRKFPEPPRSARPATSALTAPSEHPARQRTAS